jgi:hypothetical protein
MPDMIVHTNTCPHMLAYRVSKVKKSIFEVKDYNQNFMTFSCIFKLNLINMIYIFLLKQIFLA